MAARDARPVLIAGGGIGGLAAALGLAQKGIRSILLEKASALGEIGAGIQLGPNAFHAFDYLGVGEAARGMAVYIDQLRLMDALTAEEITHVDLREAFRARFGNPYAVVHRGDLHGVFLKACQAHELIELRVSSEVVGYDQDGSSVTARLASGERVTGSLLIGADGLWSNIRKQVTSDGPPRVSGHTTYRSVIPTEQMPEDLRWNAATLWAGPKCHIVHYPLSGWKVFNLVVTYHNDAPEPVAGKPVSDEEVMQGFAHVHERARRTSSATARTGGSGCCATAIPPSAGSTAASRCSAMPRIRCCNISRKAPARRWRTRCACRTCWRSMTITPPRWSAIARSAFPRTARVQLLSRAIGEHIYHPAGEHARLRNAIMGAKTCRRSDYGDLAWLYGGTGLAELASSPSLRGATAHEAIQTLASAAAMRLPSLRSARNDGSHDERSLHLQHRLPVDLAGAGLRQFVDEAHLARIFVRQQLCLDEILQPLRRIALIEAALVHHHHRLQRHAAVRQFGGEHRAFAHVGMLGEAQLDFERIDPLAGDLDQIVGAAAEEMEAVASRTKRSPV